MEAESSTGVSEARPRHAVAVNCSVERCNSPPQKNKQNTCLSGECQCIMAGMHCAAPGDPDLHPLVAAREPRWLTYKAGEWFKVGHDSGTGAVHRRVVGERHTSWKVCTAQRRGTPTFTPWWGVLLESVIHLRSTGGPRPSPLGGSTGTTLAHSQNRKMFPVEARF
jgi:hypothetical protein